MKIGATQQSGSVNELVLMIDRPTLFSLSNQPVIIRRHNMWYNSEGICGERGSTTLVQDSENVARHMRMKLVEKKLHKFLASNFDASSRMFLCAK